MAFFNLNLVQTAVPNFYAYVLQPAMAPITIAIPNHQLPTVQTNQIVEAIKAENNSSTDGSTIYLKKECVSDEELDASRLSIKIKDESDLYAQEEPFETPEILIKEEECEEVEKVGRLMHPMKFKCPHCSYATRWKGNLNKHVISRHTSSEEIQWLQCDHCSYRGKTKDYLKCHLLHVHNITVKWYSCEQCEFKAKIKAHLERHVIINHRTSEEIQWLQCEHCSYRAKFKPNLRQHVLSYHTRTDEIRWFKCQYCHFQAKRKRNLRFHILNKHTDEDKINWFYCELCPNKFKRKYSLKVHVDFVHGPDRNKKVKVRTKEIPVFIENRLCWRRVVVDDDEDGPEGSSEQCHLKCDECVLTFAHRELFKKHMIKFHTVTEIQRENDQVVKVTYKTKDVVVLVDDVPVMKKVIDVPLSRTD